MLCSQFGGAPLKPRAAAGRRVAAGAPKPKGRAAKRKVDSSTSEEDASSGSSDEEGESLPAEVRHSTD